jgi:hypothetical protein
LASAIGHQLLGFSNRHQQSASAIGISIGISISIIIVATNINTIITHETKVKNHTFLKIGTQSTTK